MSAGVAVIGLDDVAEQECRPSIGIAELERSIDSELPLASEESEQAGKGENKKHDCGGADSEKGDDKSDWSQGCVDSPHPSHEP